VVFGPLSSHSNDLGQEEKAFVDVLTLFDPKTLLALSLRFTLRVALQSSLSFMYVNTLRAGQIHEVQDCREAKLAGVLLEVMFVCGFAHRLDKEAVHRMTA
jgi:hypothetical protein